MIKINLLEVEKERRAKVTAPAATPTAVVAVIVFGAAIAAFAFYFLAIQNRLSNLEKDVEQKRAKKKELEPYIKRVDELERRKNELAKKNHAIEELRSQRTIPVHVLDEVSRAVPEYLWLTQMAMKGDLLNIDGETLQEQAIPTFMKSLDASELVGTCSLVETRQRGSTAGATSTIFKIRTPVTNPFKPKQTEEATRTTKTK